MTTPYYKVLLLSLFFIVLHTPGFAQWRVLNPRIFPPKEWHMVDSVTIRSFHSVFSYDWRTARGITGISRDGGSTWSYSDTAPSLGSYLFNMTSFYTAKEGYLLGAANDNPWTEERVLYHTTDGGEIWTPFLHLFRLWIEWGFHSAQEGFVYSVYPPSSSEINYITRDSGRSISLSHFPSGDIISFGAYGPYLVLNDTTAWLSRDSGRSFLRNSFPSQCNYLESSHLPDGHVWVLTKESFDYHSAPLTMARSSDYGQTWEAFSYPLVQGTRNRPWKLVFRDTLQGIALTSGEVRTTTDGGTTWQLSTTVITEDTLSWYHAQPRIECDPISGNVVLMDGYSFGGSSGEWDPPVRFRRSSDFGRTWTIIPNSLTWEVRDVKRWSTRDMVAVSIFSSAHYSIQGPFDSVAVLVSHDHGQTWTERILKPGPIQDHLTVFPNGGVLVGSSLYSGDYGETWQRTTLPPRIHPTAIPLFTADGMGVTATQTDSLHLMVFQSEDEGRTWNGTALLELPSRGRGYALRVIELPTKAWHLTVRFHASFTSEEVYRALSVDRGKSWTPFQRITPNAAKKSPLEPKTRDGKNYLFAQQSTDSWELYYSSDSGATYTRSRIVHRHPIPRDHTFSFLVRDLDWISDSLCYAVSGDNYCVSRDGGRTWTLESGLPLEGVQRLIIGDSTEQWFVGFYGLILQHRGLLGVLTSHESLPAAPRDLAVPITYPNPVPASGQAQVEFTLARETTVGVYVHDILGRRQRLLHEGRLTSGPHRLSLRPSDLAPGLYFITVSTPEGVKVGKMMVMGRE